VEKIFNREINFEMYKDYAVCPNGAMYRKDIRGFLPEIMEKIYKERTVYKKKMLDEKKKLEEIENEMNRRKII
jgi:DNA polymerase elongation subunit (family B)